MSRRRMTMFKPTIARGEQSKKIWDSMFYEDGTPRPCKPLDTSKFNYTPKKSVEELLKGLKDKEMTVRIEEHEEEEKDT